MRSLSTFAQGSQNAFIDSPELAGWGDEIVRAATSGQGPFDTTDVISVRRARRQRYSAAVMNSENASHQTRTVV